MTKAAPPTINASPRASIAALSKDDVNEKSCTHQYQRYCHRCGKPPVILRHDPALRKPFLSGRSNGESGEIRLTWINVGAAGGRRRGNLACLRFQQLPQQIAEAHLQLGIVQRQRAGIVEDRVDQRAQHDLEPERDGAALGGAAAFAHG